MLHLLAAAVAPNLARRVHRNAGGAHLHLLKPHTNEVGPTLFRTLPQPRAQALERGARFTHVPGSGQQLESVRVQGAAIGGLGEVRLRCGRWEVA